MVDGIIGNDRAQPVTRAQQRMEAGSVLALAAAPAFAIMALLSAAGGGGVPGMLCSAVPGSPLAGMGPMYLLMSAVHLAPWLTLLASRRGRPRPA